MMTFKITHKEILKIIYKIYPLIIQFYLIILGIFWLSLFVYFRLFAPRTSYTLESLRSTIETKHYISFTLFIIIHLMLINIILYNLMKKTKKNTIMSIFITKIQEIVNYIFWIPLDKIHTLIAPNILGSGKFFLNLEKNWTTNHVSPTFFAILILIFNIIPKLFTAFIFLIDIVILGTFKYFIYALPLLIIPIMFNIFLKTFKSFADSNLHSLKECFIEIKYVGDVFDDNGNLISRNPSEFEFHVKPEYSYAEKEMAEIVAAMIQLGAIVEYVDSIKDQIQIYTPYVTLITSGIYLVGGLYRLIYFFI